MEKKVSFAAKIVKTQTLLADRYSYGKRKRRVVFSEVIYSHGGGYSTRTGIFRAPKSGIYLFIFDVQPFDSGYVLMHNEKVLARPTANKAVIGGNVGISYLTAGEQVWVQNDGKFEYFIKVFNGRFSGILID
ncbi:protein HP-25 homolog 1-like, partial [Ruditapes philippinarum]|uniref:protein HP-25 homolog 1-like n=1 Tax=Ruditapes philippinarum TaxID=129788 RepID=UPI00295B5A96